MRFQTGFSILLVLLLGLLCVGPVKSYYYEEEEVNPNQANDNVTLTSDVKISEPNDQQLQQQNSLQAALVEPTETSSAVDDDQPNEKRSGMFGIPSSRGIAETPQQVASSNGDTSEPIPNGENSSPQQQQQQQQQQEDTELLQPANTPLSNGLQSKTTPSQESSPSQENQPPASTGRGLSSVMNGVMNNIAPQPYQANQNQQKTQPSLQAPVNTPPQSASAASTSSSSSSTGVGGVRNEDLPTIIEKNKPVSIEQQIAQQQQQQSQDQQTSSQQTTALASQTPANMSTARTFGEGWTNCVGASTGKYGTCKNDVECKKSKGVSDGSCMGGLGMCCVMALTCGDKSHENNTFFANPDFPEPSWEARLCEVEIKKKHSKILQIMIEFEELELAPPNHDGECITDVFQIKLGSSRPSPYSLLRICGQNTGQHMYLDVSQIEETIVLSVATSGGGFPRRWSIRIVQMDEKNYLLAPPGCLQYYTDTVGHFRSFNLGRNLRNLYYAICFRIDNGYSGIRFTSNFFGMNGFGCRQRIGRPIPSLGGRHNGSYIEAHPHHLVIPPSGYAPPMPPPKPKLLGHAYQHQAPIVQSYNSYQQQHPQPLPPPAYHSKPHTSPPPSYHSSPAPIAGGAYDQPYEPAPGVQPLRYKRFAYSETSERVPRTFGSDFDKKDFKEDKGFKNEHERDHFHHLQPIPPPAHLNNYGPSYQPNYDQKPVYGPQPSPGYGAPPPPPPTPYPYGYGYEPSHHHEFSKAGGAKWDDKQFKKIEKWEDAEDKKGWWDPSKFGWKSEKKDEKSGWKSDKKDEKFGWKSEKDELEYGGYGPSLPPPGYAGGPPRPPSHYYNGNYGPPPSYHGHGYGNAGGYGAYGEYHHKEIDKFGKKYEHLEYKHEKNHLDKDEKKDDKSWWFWNKKEDKKDKEKFFTHHEALFPIMHLPDMPHCEPRFCGQSDVITFPPSGDSISEMCGNRFNRGRGPKIISGSPLVVYVSNRGHSRGAGFDMNYEQVFYVPRPY